jgi:cobalt-zinc-cadmium efflux system protein
VAFIFREAWHRIQEPPHVEAGGMLAVAVVGLCVNLVSLYILTRGEGHSLNERGAMLHVLGDALGSVGAITAALVIHFTGWFLADSIVSALIGLLILRSTWELLREVVNILMEGTPIHLSFDEVHREMLAVPGVAAVTDLHMWSLASGFDAVSAHVAVPEPERGEAVRRQLKALLRERFGIRHSTLEIHPPGEGSECPPGAGFRCRAWSDTEA